MAEASKGGDPAKERRDTRQGMTMAELAKEFTTYKVNLIKRGTAANHKTNWSKNILPIIGSMKVRDLTASDVIGLHINRGKKHPVNANRCVDLIKAAMNYAELRGWREPHTNPARGIQKFPEFEKQRILSPEEIKRLFAVLDAYEPQRGVWAAPYAIKLLALSGLRKTEWTYSKWSWVSESAGTLTLHDSKTGPRIVHLSEAVMTVLAEMRQYASGKWICPDSSDDKPLAGLGRHWKIVRKRAGLDDVRLHDLRHTVGSLGHRAGLSQKQISELLGHRRLATSARYIHTYDNEKRGAADIAAAAIMGMTGK